MRRMRSPPSRLLAALVSAAAATAQTTWTVTQPGGVQAAIQNAAPGDIIVLPNTGGSPDYDPFIVNKGVTIRGNNSRIGWPVGSAPALAHEIAVTVPAGQRAHLDGLDLRYSIDGGANIGTRLVVSGGVVTVDRCSILRRLNAAAVLTNAVVVFQSCWIVADALSIGGRGIDAQGSHVTLRDCVVRGSNRALLIIGAHLFPWPAQAGAFVAGGALHAERTSFTGGSDVALPYGMPPSAGACGVAVSTASVWLSDSTITGGSGSGAAGSVGAVALCNNSAASIYVANTTLVAGLFGGSPYSGSVNAAEPLVRLSIAPPWQRGVTSTMTCRGAANNLFLLGVALDSAPAFHPFAFEPLWCVTNVPVTIGLLDATGVATFTVAVPAAPSLQYATVWCQAVGGPGMPLHASTLAGGMIL